MKSIIKEQEAYKKTPKYRPEQSIPIKYIYSPNATNFIVQLTGTLEDCYIEQAEDSQINVQTNLSEKAVSYFRAKTKKAVMYKYSVHDKQLIQSLTIATITITQKDILIIADLITKMVHLIPDPSIIISCKTPADNVKMEVLLEEIRLSSYGYRADFQKRDFNTTNYEERKLPEKPVRQWPIYLNLATLSLEGSIIYVSDNKQYIPKDIPNITRRFIGSHYTKIDTFNDRVFVIVPSHPIRKFIREYTKESKLKNKDKNKFITVMMQYYLSGAVIPNQMYDKIQQVLEEHVYMNPAERVNNWILDAEYVVRQQY